MLLGMAFTGTPVVKQISDKAVRITGLSLAAGAAGAIGLPGANAAPTNLLGVASTFGVLASTLTNTTPGTLITGDLGYVNAPVLVPEVSGNIDVNNAAYAAAVAAIGVARAALVALPATFSFAPGNINLSTDTTHGSAGVFTPGVYVITGNASTSAAQITLNGPGRYVFRCSGTLSIANGAVVVCAGGADPADVWWICGGTATIGSEAQFVGTVIPSTQPVNITLLDDVQWQGRALTVGGTVTLDADSVITPAVAGETLVLPDAFQASEYIYAGQVVELADALQCTAQAASSLDGVAQAPIAVVKTGTTAADFLITLTNTSESVPTPDLEIAVRFH